jgi:hypothetical protein
MFLANISDTVDAGWTVVEPVHVGRVPPGLGAPACFVTVSDGERRVLRVDVYAPCPDCFAFQGALT